MGGIIRRKLEGQDLINAMVRNPRLNINIESGAQQIANDPRIQQLLMQQQQQRIAAQPKKKNILQSIGESFIDPFKKTAGFVGLGGAILGNDKKGFDRIKGQFFGEDANLGLEGLKTIAGLGSLLIPGGGTAAKAVIGGGLSGALGGLSQANLKDGLDIQDFQDIGGGALMGGVTGGVLKGGSKLFGRGGNKVVQEGGEGFMGRMANKVDNSLLGIQPKGTATGIMDAKKLADATRKILLNEGEKIGGQGLNNAYGKIVGQLDNVLVNSTQKLPTNSILDNFTQKLADEGIEYGQKGAVSTVTNQLQNKLLQAVDNQTGEIAPAALAKLKSSLDNQLSNVYKKTQMGAALSPEETTKVAFRESIDKVLKKGVPEARPFYKKLTTLHGAAKDVTKAYTKSGAISSPLALGGVKIPTFGATNTAKRGLSTALRAMDKIGLPTGGGMLNNKITRGGMKNLPMASGGAFADQSGNQQSINEFNQKNPLTSMENQLLPFVQQSQEPSQMPYEQYLQVHGLQDSPQAQMAYGQDVLPAEQDGGQTNTQAQRMELFNQLLQAGLKQNDAIARVNFMIPEVESSAKSALSATQQQAQSRSNLGLTGVTDLEQLLNEGADIRGAGLRGALPGFLKTSGDKQLNLAKDQIVEAIGRLQSGGAISPAEAERFEKFVPETWDDQGTIQKKLQKLRSFFQQAGGTGAF